MDKLDLLKDKVELVNTIESEVILLEEKAKEASEEAINLASNYFVNLYRASTDAFYYKYYFVLNSELTVDLTISIKSPNVENIVDVQTDINFVSIVPFSVYKRLLSESSELSTDLNYIHSKIDLTENSLEEFLIESKEFFVNNIDIILNENGLDYLLPKESRVSAIQKFENSHKYFEKVLNVANSNDRNLLLNESYVNKKQVQLLESFLHEKSAKYLSFTLNKDQIETNVTKPKVKI